MNIIIGIILICLALSSQAKDGVKVDRNRLTDYIDGTACATLGNANYVRTVCDSDTSISSHAFYNFRDDIHSLQVEFYEKGSEEKPLGPLHSLSLHSESFAGLVNLTNLLIMYANIDFKGASLAPMESLKKLIFQTCGFTDVPTGILTSAPNLEKLSFEGNRICVIKPNAFAPLKNLRNLNLTLNRIQSLQPDSFKGLDKLETLDLSYNDFAVLPGMLSGLNQLTTLDLTRALLPDGYQDRNPKEPLFLKNVTVLQPGMFNDTPHLQYLKLDRNPMRNIPKDVFNNLKSLKVLSMTMSGIEIIEPGAFSGLTLEKLDLSGTANDVIAAEVLKSAKIGGLLPYRNHILKIGPKTFDKLSVLTLNMSSNIMTSIGSDDFYGLDVDTLDLYNNMIMKIMPEAFKNTKVKKLMIIKGFLTDIIVEENRWGLPESVIIE